jgi:hypothetical protein
MIFSIPKHSVWIACAVLVVSGQHAFGQVFTEDHRFVPDNLPTGYGFGYLVEIDQGVLTVGAITSDVNGGDVGSVYLAKQTSPANAILLSSEVGDNFNNYGPRTAIGDGMVAASVRTYSDKEGYGRVVYLYDATEGTRLFEISPDDSPQIHAFGRSLAINDGLLAVGEYYDDDNGEFSGSVHLYDVQTGEFIRKLLAEDGQPSDVFGIDVAISDGMIAVGASGDDDLAPSSGAVYLFDANTGQQLRKLVADDGHISGNLGSTITMGDGVVAVGTSRDDEIGPYTGAVYLFDTATGDQIAKLFPDTPVDYAYFGSAVAISDGVLAVGAREEATGEVNGVGAAYLHTRTQLAKLIPSEDLDILHFGNSIAIEPGTVVVGSRKHAYIFNMNTISCPPDLNGDGSLYIFDALAFIDAYIELEPLADFNDDGDINIFDALAFIAAYNTGCP